MGSIFFAYGNNVSMVGNSQDNTISFTVGSGEVVILRKLWLTSTATAGARNCAMKIDDSSGQIYTGGSGYVEFSTGDATAGQIGADANHPLIFDEPIVIRSGMTVNFKLNELTGATNRVSVNVVGRKLTGASAIRFIADYDKRFG